MEHNLEFELGTNDIMKMQPVLFGHRYRALLLCAYAPMLAFCLYNIFTGENIVLNSVIAIPALVMLFDRWLLYPPYLAMRDTNARVKIDSRNLTSSLGTKTYDIPWPYFVQHGSVLETDDHFYFKCKLGKIYLPKRAFPNPDALNQFRNDLRLAIGSKFETHGMPVMN